MHVLHRILIRNYKPPIVLQYNHPEVNLLPDGGFLYRKMTSILSRGKQNWENVCFLHSMSRFRHNLFLNMLLETLLLTKKSRTKRKQTRTFGSRDWIEITTLSILRSMTEELHTWTRGPLDHCKTLTLLSSRT